MADNNLDIWVKISSQIGELTSSVNGVLSKLAEHEQRILAVERGEGREGGWKNELLMLLAKCVLIGGTALASLAGAGGLLDKFVK